MKLGKPTDGPISRYINRRFSQPISMALVRINRNINPNVVTIFTTIIGILAGISFFIFDVWLAGILVQLASILDGVDGEIARLTGKTSRKGGFLDAIMDRLVDITVIIGLSLFALGLYENISENLIFILGMSALSGSVLVSYFNARGEASLGKNPRYFGALPIATRDVRLFIIFVGCLFQALFYWSILITLLIITLLSYGFLFVNLIIVWRNFVDVSGETNISMNVVNNVK